MPRDDKPAGFPWSRTALCALDKGDRPAFLEALGHIPKSVIDSFAMDALLRCDEFAARAIADIGFDWARRCPRLHSSGGSPAMIAAAFNRPKAFFAFMSVCPSPAGATDRFGQSCMHAAVSGGNAEIVQWLLDRGDDPNAARIDGARPLRLIQDRRAEHLLSMLPLMQALRRAGCNPFLPDNAGFDPLTSWIQERRAIPAAALCRVWPEADGSLRSEALALLGSGGYAAERSAAPELFAAIEEGSYLREKLPAGKCDKRPGI